MESSSPICSRFPQSEATPSRSTETVRTSLAAHVKEHRMERAAELLLETGDSMAQIARAVGYESQSKFTTAFKEFYQTLPTEYRRQHKRDAAGTRAGRNGHGR